MRGVDHLRRADVDTHLVEHGVHRPGHRRLHVAGVAAHASGVAHLDPENGLRRRPVVDAAQPDVLAAVLQRRRQHERPERRPGLPPAGRSPYRRRPRRRSRRRSRRSSGRPTPVRRADRPAGPSTPSSRRRRPAAGALSRSSARSSDPGCRVPGRRSRSPRARLSRGCRRARRRRRGSRRLTVAAGRGVGKVARFRSICVIHPPARIPSRTDAQRLTEASKCVAGSVPAGSWIIPASTPPARREILHVLAEVRLRRSLHSVGTATEIDEIQVLLEDLVLRLLLGDLGGENDLLVAAPKIGPPCPAATCTYCWVMVASLPVIAEVKSNPGFA